MTTKTNAQPAALPPNPYAARCMSRDVLAHLTDKWTFLIIASLQSGPMRFCELTTGIEGITTRALSLALKKLEREGLVIRKVYPSTPVRLEYALTALGESAVEPLQSLITWVCDNMPAIKQAREDFDQATTADLT